MITFEKIRFKNFLSYGNSWTEINLNKHKDTLVIGENGAGKSTFLDALSYALYMKPFRKVNNPQLVNSINKKHLYVEVEFKVGGNHYKDCKIQPVEFIVGNDLTFLEGNIIKYITRHRRKGEGRKDIEKVIHYAEMILEMEYNEQ